jgi:hypothetical protein
MLLNVAANNVSIWNVKVSKRERHIMYSVTKRTVSLNVQRYKTLSAHYVMRSLHFVTVYVLWRCTLRDVYVLKTLRFGTLCMQLRFVTLPHVTFTLCCFTLCSNIPSLTSPWASQSASSLFLLQLRPRIEFVCAKANLFLSAGAAVSSRCKNDQSSTFWDGLYQYPIVPVHPFLDFLVRSSLGLVKFTNYQKFTNLHT